MNTYSIEIRNMSVPFGKLAVGETRTVKVTAPDAHRAHGDAIRRMFGSVANSPSTRNSDGSETRSLTGKGVVADSYGRIYIYVQEVA